MFVCFFIIFLYFFYHFIAFKIDSLRNFFTAFEASQCNSLSADTSYSEKKLLQCSFRTRIEFSSCQQQKTRTLVTPKSCKSKRHPLYTYSCLTHKQRTDRPVNSTAKWPRRSKYTFYAQRHTSLFSPHKVRKEQTTYHSRH